MSGGSEKPSVTGGEEDRVVAQQPDMIEQLGNKDTANWEKPVCLIENKDSKMVINEEAVRLLSKVPGPMIVVAIVGLYRTGKSFLLNLLAGRTAGFPLGNTTNACTKGIWVWLLNHPSKKGCFLLLMDTEGLGDVRKGDTANDSQLYVLAVLLSSILVHNSCGVIDNEALEKLQFITKMAEEIDTETGREKDGLDLRKYFPTFVWAVRDFTLKLVDEQNNPTTSTHYLEEALKERKGMTPKIEAFNFIRKCIREFFPQRECFTFPYPVPDANDMGALEKMTLSQLTPKFKEQAQKFKQFIHDEGTTKAYQDEPVTGRTFCELARTYLKTVQENGALCIQSSIETSSRIVNTRVIEESVRIYQSGYPPTVEFVETLTVTNRESVNEAIVHFIESAFYDRKDEFLCLLKKNLVEEYDQVLSKHESESRRRCKACLDEKSSKLSGNHASRHYIQPNGYQLYKQDMKALEKAYNATAKLGYKRRYCWDQFLKEQQTTADAIMAADIRLTREEKKGEEQAREMEELRKRLKQTDEQLAEKSQEWNDRLNNYAGEMYQFHLKSKRDAQMFTKEHESLWSKHSKMLHSGFQNKADDLMKTIEVQKISRNQIKREPFYNKCEQRLAAMKADHTQEIWQTLQEQERFLTETYNAEIRTMQDALQKIPGDGNQGKRAEIEKELQEADQNQKRQLDTLRKEAQTRISEFGRQICDIEKELTDNFKGRGRDNAGFWQNLFGRSNSCKP